MHKIYFSLVILFIPLLIIAMPGKRYIHHFQPDKVMLGIIVKDAEADDLKELNVDGGAVILKVISGSEADRIGLKKGDIIIKIDDQEIKNADELHRLISGIKEEKSLKITFYHKGELQTTQAKLSPGKGFSWNHPFTDDSSFFNWNWQGEQPWCGTYGPFNSTKGGYLGIKVKTISKQLQEYFEVDHGVLVETVFKDTPAEKAGISAGDIILKIGDKKVEDYEDVIRIINYYNPEDKVIIEVSRKGKEKSFEVTLGKKEPARFLKHLKDNKQWQKWLDNMPDPEELNVQPDVKINPVEIKIKLIAI